jgi:hypothetical protein
MPRPATRASSPCLCLTRRLRVRRGPWEHAWGPPAAPFPLDTLHSPSSPRLLPARHPLPLPPLPCCPQSPSCSTAGARRSRCPTALSSPSPAATRRCPPSSGATTSSCTSTRGSCTAPCWRRRSPQVRAKRGPGRWGRWLSCKWGLARGEPAPQRQRCRPRATLRPESLTPPPPPRAPPPRLGRRRHGRVLVARHRQGLVLPLVPRPHALRPAVDEREPLLCTARRDAAQHGAGGAQRERGARAGADRGRGHRRRLRRRGALAAAG